MACGTCKDKKGTIVEELTIPDNSGKKISLKKIINTLLKVLYFLILLVVLTPIVLIAFFVVLFRYTVINKDLNIVPLLKYIGQKLMKNEDDEDEDEEEDEEHNENNSNEELYELENPNDIIVLKQ